MYMSALPVASTVIPWYQKLLTDVGPQVLTVYQQYKLNDENLKRARTGQPPITAENYRLIAPPSQVEVGMNPETKKMIMIMGAGLLGVLVLSTFLLKSKKKK